ncbi:MAG: nucleoside permease [Bacteroidota bacterium]
MLTATRVKLSTMMFLEYFVWGSWFVTLGTYLGTTLHFDGPQIGGIYTTVSIAAIVSPFFVGLIADRFFATQKVLGTLHLIGGIMLYVVSQQTSFVSFYATLLAYTLCYMPTLALTNAVAFRQMSDPGKEFGLIRVLGTTGWIVVGLLIGFLKIESSALTFQIAAAASILLGIYSFFLPHTPPQATGPVSIRDILGLDALALLKDRSFATMFIASMLICIPLAFYYSFANPFLNEVGLENAAGKMTMGQMSELGFMLLLPFFLTRLGVKRIVLLAMVCWSLRYVLFAFGNNGSMAWMLYLGIILHGICYDFFFVTGQIFVDRKAPAHLRSSAQGMITLATYGIGMLIGSWVAGSVVGQYTNATTLLHDWKSIWLVPAIAALVILLLFALLFKEKAQTQPVANGQG